MNKKHAVAFGLINQKGYQALDQTPKILKPIMAKAIIKTLLLPKFTEYQIKAILENLLKSDWTKAKPDT